VQGFAAPMGVTVLTGTPLQVGATSNTAISYEFDPTASGIERDLVIEYLDASSVLVRDTVHVTPIIARINIDQKVESNGLDVNAVQVSSSFDLTDFEVRDMDFAIHFAEPDLFELSRDSIKLNAALLPNATFDLKDLGAGSYRLEIRSADPLSFDQSVSLAQQPFFSYHPRAFATIESSTLADVTLINTELCAELTGDTVTLFTSEFCGDDAIRDALNDASISNIKLFPNPVIKGDLKIEFNAAIEGATEFVVRDLGGNEITRLTQATTAGTNSTVLPASEMADGVYFLSIRSANFSRELKFVVEH
jgi:hypothetical protein